jgi:hypothetical protein
MKWVLHLPLIFWAIVFALASEAPESLKIAGLRPLFSSLGDGQKMFPGLTDSSFGAKSYSESFDVMVGGCELGVRSDRRMTKRSPIEVVVLRRLSSELRECSNLKIGLNLSMASKQNVIEKQLPWLKKKISDGNSTIYEYSDDTKCSSSGNGRSFSITVKYNVTDDRIEYIIIENSNSSCRERARDR